MGNGERSSTYFEWMGAESRRAAGGMTSAGGMQEGVRIGRKGLRSEVKQRGSIIVYVEHSFVIIKGIL